MRANSLPSLVRNSFFLGPLAPHHIVFCLRTESHLLIGFFACRKGVYCLFFFSHLFVRSTSLVMAPWPRLSLYAAHNDFLLMILLSNKGTGLPHKRQFYAPLRVRVTHHPSIHNFLALSPLLKQSPNCSLIIPLSS